MNTMNDVLNIMFKYDMDIEPVNNNYSFVTVKLTDNITDTFFVENDNLIWFIENINNHNYNPYTEEFING